MAGASTILPRRHHPCPLVPASLLGRVTSPSCPQQRGRVHHRDHTEAQAGLALRELCPGFLWLTLPSWPTGQGLTSPLVPFPPGGAVTPRLLGRGVTRNARPARPGPTSGAARPTHSCLEPAAVCGRRWRGRRGTRLGPLRPRPWARCWATVPTRAAGSSCWCSACLAAPMPR